MLFQVDPGTSGICPIEMLLPIADNRAKQTALRRRGCGGIRFAIVSNLFDLIEFSPGLRFDDPRRFGNLEREL
jgi:hypothetical protein